MNALVEFLQELARWTMAGTSSPAVLNYRSPWLNAGPSIGGVYGSATLGTGMVIVYRDARVLAGAVQS